MTDKRSKVQLLANYIWYSSAPAATVLSVLLLPLTVLFYLLAKCRKSLFVLGLKKQYRAPVPVIVVGNVLVGGTGKTPFIISLLEYLQQQGFKPGVVSRGYGVQLQQPVLLSLNTVESSSRSNFAAQAGDEAAMIFLRCQCPVACYPQREEAIKLLLSNTECDVIISDDGLQHYAISRDIEVVLVDVARQFGNGLLLPSGPLREGKGRLNSVDYVVNNGGPEMSLKPSIPRAVSISNPQSTISVEELQQQTERLCFVTGIGNPQRFFKTMQELGLEAETRVFADHHAFSVEDFSGLENKIIIMTEKDAVKCKQFAADNWWYLPVDAQLDQQLLASIKKHIEQVQRNIKKVSA